MPLQRRTKYRYGVIDSRKYKTLCEAVLLSIAEEHGIEILEMGVEPEHIHLIVRAPMSMGPSKALQLLKGGSSYRLRKLLPEFKVMYFQGHLWSPGKAVRPSSQEDLKVNRRLGRGDSKEVCKRTVHPSSVRAGGVYRLMAGSPAASISERVPFRAGRRSRWLFPSKSGESKR